ncbi:CRISPR-associated endoribonuclease Cas6 [Pyrococcus yayanosii]|uniref:CRISPR associated protein Cas6 C-terminal domain-containing protein n=1 Tax=Pyrococcus yayanosii (strain CH1 / JCM 16557) TaxID=529709 RepID=F8AG52_PYRYC|nr:CRISPR-associated endoribonuclease Cas6 [Pyrococcus yayanosii]AEH25113.1 hypothetical protein PYCH_14430 [Pyrococcus yayanosii CH1]
MRLKLSLLSKNGRVKQVNKHAVQGFIYNMLKGSPYEKRHDEPKFKFFTFSDFFVDSKGRLSLLISSPDKEFINTLHESIRARDWIHIGQYEFEVLDVKKFSLKLRNRFQTGSPIVLYKDKDRGEYFKLHYHRDLGFFLWRLKENAIKKYEAFYGEPFVFEGPIFDRLIPKVRRNGKLDVYVKVVKNGTSFVVIGSNWELLEKERIKAEERKFYRFIMDAGLGEKNSLGFGFINPIRR